MVSQGQILAEFKGLRTMAFIGERQEQMLTERICKIEQDSVIHPWDIFPFLETFTSGTS